MPASPVRVNVSQEELQKAQEKPRGAGFSALPVPIDVIVEVTDVVDHRAKESGNKGLKWVLAIYAVDPTVDLGSVNPAVFEGLDFDYYTMFSEGARRRLLRHMMALGHSVEDGVNDFDPNDYIGTLLGARVDYPREFYELSEDERISEGPWYKEIRFTFALAERPALAELADVKIPDDYTTDDEGWEIGGDDYTDTVPADVAVQEELEEVETI